MRAAALCKVAAGQAALLRSIRTATPTPAKVTSVYCERCRRWRKPSRFYPHAAVCRSCRGGGPVVFGEPRKLPAPPGGWS
jgi:hypothetical protein